MSGKESPADPAAPKRRSTASAARRTERAAGPSDPDPEAREPCLRCGWLLPRRVMGCKGGRCPNCGHQYPHGDCSD